MKFIKLLVLGLLTVGFVACSQKSAISDGSIVKVTYKGTLEDGTVFDTTENKDPLTFLVGANQVIPEFEKQITRLKPGQSKSFKISAKEAYGEPDPKKVITLPKDGKFNDIELKEGSVIFANNKAPNGQVVQTPMKVVKLTDKEVTLDYNHPLAGKNLQFDVTLVEIKEPQVGTPASSPEAAPAEPKA